MPKQQFVVQSPITDLALTKNFNLLISVENFVLVRSVDIFAWACRVNCLECCTSTDVENTLLLKALVLVTTVCFHACSERTEISQTESLEDVLTR